MDSIEVNDLDEGRTNEKTQIVDDVVRKQAEQYLKSTYQMPAQFKYIPLLQNEDEDREDFESRQFTQARIISQQQSDEKSACGKCSLLYCDIHLDILKLCETLPFLANFVLNDEDCGRWLFREILKQLLQGQLEIVVNIDFASWPEQDFLLYRNNRITNAQGTCQSTIRSLVNITGILVSMSPLTEFVRSSSYKCSDSSCQNSQVTNYRHIRFPGFLTSSGISATEIKSGCSLCCSPLIEDPKRRDVSELVIGILIPCDALESPAVLHKEQIRPLESRYNQGTPIFFGKNRFPSLNYGQRYHIIGNPLFSAVVNNAYTGKESTSIDNIPHPPYLSGGGHVFECMGLKDSVHPLHRAADLQAQDGEGAHLSVDIYQMYLRSLTNSPWTFLLSLAYEFGSEICPRELFIKLKLSILLSLASTTSGDEDWPLPLMVVASDTNFSAKLMRYGMNLAERSVLHNAEMSSLIPSGSPCAVNCGILTSAHKCGSLYTDAGSILLAKGGVCYLGEIQHYKKPSLETVRVILEEGRVQTNIKDVKRKACFRDQPLSTSLWAVCTLHGTKKSADFERQKFAFVMNHKSLLDSFGLVLTVENDNLKQMNAMEDSLVDYILDQAVYPQNDRQDVPDRISGNFDAHGNDLEASNASSAKDNSCDEKHLCFEELKAFLFQARHKTLQIEVEAIDIIKRYFVASRRSRSSSLDVSGFGTQSLNSSISSVSASKSGHVPQSTIKTLTTMAESHAKLSMKSSVDVDDAVLAIYLYEENIQALYGNGCVDWSTSPIVIGHEPHLRDGYSGFDIIESLKSAKSSIFQFIDSFTGDLSYTRREE